ncbi:MAG: M48 family metalloprotease [Acidobacteria bacterium]|nr:M48 family metalloprotease [Acidobacteriota bacterium]
MIKSELIEPTPPNCPKLHCNPQTSAISRSREYAADHGAGVLTKRPQDLMVALQKLQTAIARQPMPETAGSNVTAHLFIVNPFKLSSLAVMLSTRPTFEQRAAQLRNLQQELECGPEDRG